MRGYPYKAIPSRRPTANQESGERSAINVVAEGAVAHAELSDVQLIERLFISRTAL